MILIGSSVNYDSYGPGQLYLRKNGIYLQSHNWQIGLQVSADKTLVVLAYFVEFETNLIHFLII